MAAQSFPGGPPIQKGIRVRRVDWPGLASGALLAAGTIAAYCRTFSFPLHFDDAISLTDNASIRKLWPIWSVLSPPNDAGVGGRPLLNLSYALNYAFGGMAVSGYHTVNLLIHVLAAWTLFALVRRTLQCPVLAERFGSAATSLALAVSAVWAWHPVQTESVTYLSQRAESLMGLFYLLTLDWFTRGAAAENERNRRIWFSLSVLACLAGTATKEVIVTAPLMVFLYDRTFISGSLSNAWRRHWPQHVALAGTWLPLGYLMSGLHDRTVGFGQGVSWWAYGLTECHAIVKYLLLCFWPHPLVFDYGMAVAQHLSDIWPSALMLASLLIVTIVALTLWPQAGFAGCWFFLILAPTSSIVPIIGQPMAENRLYLPLAGIAVGTVVGAFAVAGRRSLAAFAVVAAGFGFASFQRNQDYSSEPALWNDTVAKNPANPRAHYNLGYAWANTPGRLNDAIVQYEEALRLKPDYTEAHNNLGSALIALGRTTEAIEQYREALRLQPAYAEAHNNLGNALSNIPGRLNDAIVQFEEALRLKPDYAEAHNNLGNARLNTPGELNYAVSEYEQALRLKPDFAEAHFNLAIALLAIHAPTEEARKHLNAFLRLRPGNEAARQILAQIPASQP